MRRLRAIYHWLFVTPRYMATVQLFAEREIEEAYRALYGS